MSPPFNIFKRRFGSALKAFHAQESAPMRPGIRQLVLMVLCGAASLARGEQPIPSQADTCVVRIGAVAYAPSAVTVFRDLTRYLNENGLRSDYVLYSNYDSLVIALERGEVDIAWNTPLAHARYHVRNQCSSQTLVMRDVDFNFHSVLVARADANIESLKELAGKKLIVGSSQAAEATVLPLHFLRKSGVDLDKVQILSLDAEVDSQGNPCSSPRHVLQALRAGRGDAGIITAELWKSVQDQPSAGGALRQVWTSPPFSHCVFTASASFDKDLAARFTRLMTKMDPREPATREVMRLEGTKQWLPGSPSGFEALVEALRDEQP